MKSIFTLLLLLPIIGFTQQKKDTKIIVHVSDTSDVFNRVIKTFYQNDYVIDRQDEKNGFILTKERTLKKDKSASIIIKAFVSGNTIIFSAQVASNISMSFGSAKVERTFYDVYFGGMKGSSLRYAWNELDAFAKRFGSVSYSK